MSGGNASQGSISDRSGREEQEQLGTEIKQYAQQNFILCGSEIPKFSLTRPTYTLPVNNASCQLFKVLTLMTSNSFNAHLRAKRSKNTNKKYFEARMLPITYSVPYYDLRLPHSGVNSINSRSIGRGPVEAARHEERMSPLSSPSKSVVTAHSHPHFGEIPLNSLLEEACIIMSVNIADGKFTMNTPTESISSGMINTKIDPTLRETLTNERRLTVRNILRWSYQILGFVHSCHMSFVCLGDLDLDDFRLLPDLCVLHDLSASRKLAEAVKQRQRELWRDQEAIQSDIAAVLKKKFDGTADSKGLQKKAIEEFKTHRYDRDAWYDPHRSLLRIVELSETRSTSNSYIHLFAGHPTADMIRSAKQNNQPLPTIMSKQLLPLIPELLPPSTTRDPNGSNSSSQNLRASLSFDESTLGLPEADGEAPAASTTLRAAKGLRAMDKSAKFRRLAKKESEDLLRGIDIEADRPVRSPSPSLLDSDDEGNKTNVTVLDFGLTMENVRKIVPLDPICPTFFACLGQYENLEAKGLGSVSIRENDRSLVECKAQYTVYNIMRHKNLRYIGSFIIQMITHDLFTKQELHDLCTSNLTRAQLTARFPIIYRFPAVIADILEICFQPLEYGIMEPHKGFTHPHVRFRTKQLSRSVGNAIENLRAIVMQDNENIRWVRPIIWNHEDEMNRVQAIAQSHIQSVEHAAEGRAKADLRLRIEAKKLRFELLPMEVQRKILLRRKMIQKSNEKKKERRGFMKQAMFRHWSVAEATPWVADALFTSFRNGYIQSKACGRFIKPTAATILEAIKMEHVARDEEEGLVEGEVEAIADVKTQQQKNGAAANGRKGGRKANQFLDQKLGELLDPIQQHIEKVLMRAGYMFHGRKQLPTPFETDLDQENLYRATSSRIARQICPRMSNMLLFSELTQARQKTNARLNHSTLATRVSEETLHTKKILTTAEIIAKNLAGLRTGVLEFAKEMEIADRNWAKKMVLSVCICLAEKFDSTEWVRKRGEMLASAKINALYRSWKTRRLIHNVWAEATIILKDELAKEKEEWAKKIISGEIQIEIPDFDAEQFMDDEDQIAHPVEVIDASASRTSIELTVAANLSVSRFTANPECFRYATAISCILFEPPLLPNVVSNDLTVFVRSGVERPPQVLSAASAAIKPQPPSLQRGMSGTMQLRNKPPPGKGINSISSSNSAQNSDFANTTSLSASDFTLDNGTGLQEHAGESESRVVDLLGEGYGDIVVIMYDSRQLTDVNECLRKYLVELGKIRAGMNVPTGTAPVAVGAPLSFSSNGASNRRGTLNSIEKPLLAGFGKKKIAELPPLNPVTLEWLGKKQDEELIRETMRLRMAAIQRGLPMPAPLVSPIDIIKLTVNGLKPFTNYRVRVMMSDIFSARTESQIRNFDIYAFVKANIIPMEGAIPVLRTLIAPPDNPSDLHVQTVTDVRTDAIARHSGPMRRFRKIKRRIRDELMAEDDADGSIQIPIDSNTIPESCETEVPASIWNQYGDENLIFAVKNAKKESIPYRLLLRTGKSKESVVRRCSCSISLDWTPPYSNGSAIFVYEVQRRIFVDFHKSKKDPAKSRPATGHKKKSEKFPTHTHSQPWRSSSPILSGSRPGSPTGTMHSHDGSPRAESRSRSNSPCAFNHSQSVKSPHRTKYSPYGVERNILPQDWQRLESSHARYSDVLTMADDIDLEQIKRSFLQYHFALDNTESKYSGGSRPGTGQSESGSTRKRDLSPQSSANSGPFHLSIFGAPATDRPASRSGLTVDRSDLELTRLLPCHWSVYVEYRVRALNEEGYSDFVGTKEKLHLCDIVIEQLSTVEMMDIQSAFVRTLADANVPSALGITPHVENESNGSFDLAKSSITSATSEPIKVSTKSKISKEVGAFLFPHALFSNQISTISSLQQPKAGRAHVNGTQNQGDDRSVNSSAAGSGIRSLQNGSRSRISHQKQFEAFEEPPVNIRNSMQILQKQRLRKFTTILASNTATVAEKDSFFLGFGSHPAKQDSSVTAPSSEIVTTMSTSASTTASENNMDHIQSSTLKSTKRNKSLELIKGRLRTSIPDTTVDSLLKNFLSPSPGGQVCLTTDPDFVQRIPQHKWGHLTVEQMKAEDEAHLMSMHATSFEIAQSQKHPSGKGPKSSTNPSATEFLQFEKSTSFDFPVSFSPAGRKYSQDFSEISNENNFNFRQSRGSPSQLVDRPGNEATDNSAVSSEIEKPNATIEPLPAPNVGNDLSIWLKRLEAHCPLK